MYQQPGDQTPYQQPYQQPYQPQPSQPLYPPPQQPYVPHPSQVLIQPVVVQRAPGLRNETMKMWAIGLFAGGFLLNVMGAVLIVVGIGACILPFGFIAYVAGFICLCMI
jgi:hypothetical protein